MICTIHNGVVRSNACVLGLVMKYSLVTKEISILALGTFVVIADKDVPKISQHLADRNGCRHVVSVGP